MIEIDARNPHVVLTNFPEEAEVVHSISLGAGTQSTAMYLMASHGLLMPTPAVAIFADTGWEPPDIYTHLAWLQQISQLMPNPIPIHVVSAGDIYANVWNGQRVHGNHPWTDIPTFTINEDGSHGMGARQCTQNYKVKPIIRRLRDIVNRPSGRRHSLPPFAAQWIGISLDEWQRMKDARDKWIYNAHPLVDLRMTRQDCINWFREQYPSRPLVKSSCVGCPYHSNREWLRIYRNFPEEAQRAIELDAQLRSPERTGIEPNSKTMQFLHKDRRPLDEVLTRIDYLDRLQPSMFPENESGFAGECGGNCNT